MSSIIPSFNERLTELEQQIHRYRGVLESGMRRLKFPQEMEAEYTEHTNRAFLNDSRGILAFGILMYLAFGFADGPLGRDQANTIWLIRVSLTSVLLLGLIVIYARQWVQVMVPATSLGMILIGLSVVYFIGLMDEPYSYAYHLGLVPLQVFILVALRSHVRAIAITSFTVFAVHSYYMFSHEFKPVHADIDELVPLMRILFIIFWGLLLSMGLFLAYQMEYVTRADFLKNRLLTLDAKRLKLLGQELHLLSTTDGLTGLANRRHFENCYDAEWRRALRSQDSLTLIMIDIDFFKHYNDHYGHQAGDECLRRIADVFSSYAQRSGELVARYGGEEFVIMLPRTSLEAGQSLARSVRAKVEGLDIPHEASSQGKVTISAGVACCIPEQQGDSEALLRMADKSLYQAKGAGRNEVV